MRCIVLCAPSAQVVNERALHDVPLLLEAAAERISFELRPTEELEPPVQVEAIFRSQRVIDLLAEGEVYAVVIQYPPQRGNTALTAKLGVICTSLATLGQASSVYESHSGWACFWRKPEQSLHL